MVISSLISLGSGNAFSINLESLLPTAVTILGLSLISRDVNKDSALGQGPIQSLAHTTSTVPCSCHWDIPQLSPCYSLLYF